LNDGSKTFTCEVCGHQEVETISKIPHTEQILAAVPATCTTDGKTQGKQCSVCYTVLVEQTRVPAQGHQFGAWQTVSELSCETDGVKKHTCIVAGCGKTETQTVTATGHNWVVDEFVAKDCLTDGYTDSHCENCQETKHETIEKGHIWVGLNCKICGLNKNDNPEAILP
jgi:hypothetical protein